MTDKNIVLSQLLDRMSNKFETTIQINLKSSSGRTSFVQPIELKKELSYKVAVTQFSVFNMPQLVNSSNNQLRYSKDAGVTWKNVSIPPGAYQYTELNTSIEGLLTTNGDWIENAIVIGVNEPLGKFTITLATNYRIDFSISNSIGIILGFNSKIISASSNLADNLGNLEGGVNTINILSDISEGGYITNNSGLLVKSGIIFTIPFLSVGLGQKIVEIPSKPIYYMINQSTIRNIFLSIVDDKGKTINFGEQVISINLHITQV
mgnify:CR=1 FL=1